MWGHWSRSKSDNVRTREPIIASSPARALARVAVVAVATVAAALLCVLGAAGALAQPASSGTWGPDRLAYLAGLVCRSGAGSAALVSWPSPVDGQPAYALDPVVGPASGTAGHYTVPALDAEAVGPVPTDLSSEQANALAYLLARQGGASDQSVVAGVAAAVATLRSSDPRLQGCATSAADLWAEAQRLAGPYTITVTSAAHKLIMGQGDPVTALVTAASGAPVPGLSVSFTASAADAALAPVTAVTDATGRVQTALTVPTRSSTTSVRVRASVTVPGGVVALSAPHEATLVEAGASKSEASTLAVPVDLTADPVVTASLSRPLVLPGMPVAASVKLAGMRGHSGAAGVTVAGPLRFQRGTGCSGYHRADWAGAASGSRVTPAPTVAVTGDGSTAAGAITPVTSGCYLVTAAVSTSDAVPDVKRHSAGTVLAVAPLKVTLASDTGGVSLPGELHGRVSVQGDVANRLTGLTGDLLGPRPSTDGSCVGLKWSSAPHAGTVTFTATPTGADVTSAPVSGIGCYAFEIAATLQIPGAGSVPISIGGGTTATTLVLDPTTSVVDLSSSSAPVGGQVSASVTVSDSYTQAGAVQLQLLRLPYDWRGCFGRDWSHATAVTTASAPSTPTDGDGTYSVRSAKIPSSGCWTVLPVFSLKANPSVHVAQTAVVDSTLAFTGVDPTADSQPRDVSDLVGGSGDSQLWRSGLLMLVLLLGAAVATTTIALRSDPD